MRRRKRELAGPPAQGARSEMETPPPLVEVSKISDKREIDPHLRPFIVSVANAIIKDMLREQKEREP